MDSRVQEFINKEKQSNTDLSHKCVAKKFSTWLSKYRSHKVGSEKITLSRQQHSAFRVWTYDQPPHIPPPELIEDRLFARFLMYCLLELKNNKSSLRAAHG